MLPSLRFFPTVPVDSYIFGSPRGFTSRLRICLLSRSLLSASPRRLLENCTTNISDSATNFQFIVGNRNRVTWRSPATVSLRHPFFLYFRFLLALVLWVFSSRSRSGDTLLRDAGTPRENSYSAPHPRVCGSRFTR